jgi:hypothetical protein
MACSGTGLPYLLFLCSKLGFFSPFTKCILPAGVKIAKIEIIVIFMDVEIVSQNTGIIFFFCLLKYAIFLRDVCRVLTLW